jgi:hypothetical protein
LSRHDGGDRDAVGHERGRVLVVIGPSPSMLTRRRGASGRRMIVTAASGSVVETIAPRARGDLPRQARE